MLFVAVAVETGCLLSLGIHFTLDHLLKDLVFLVVGEDGGFSLGVLVREPSCHGLLSLT